jgi:phage replication O-like protein O
MTSLARIADHDRYELREIPKPEGKGAQLEDGYVRTATAIVEAFAKAPLTSREARVIRAVERATFGWQRSSARLSQEALAKMTGLTPKRCSESVNGLIRKKVLFRDGGSRSPIGINTKVTEWNFEPAKARVTPKQPDSPKWGQRPQDGVTERPQDRDTYKDSKDTLEPKGSKSTSKKSSPKKWGEEIDHELAEFMFSTLTAHLTNPKRKSMTAWANEIRLMRTIDQRRPDQIRYLCNWIARDGFWRGNVMCPAKLREKWDQLESKVIAYKESRHANRPGTDEKRANQDRVAAMLSDPNDTSWIEGLFDEESGDLGAGQPGVHSTGGDLPQDVENGIFDTGHGEAGEAGSGYIDGEVVDAADDQEPGRSTGADQGRGRRVASERGEADFEHEAEAGGFWNA